MEERTPEGFLIIRSDNMDEYVAAISKRPGMFVGEVSLDKVALYLYGYGDGYRRGFEDADAPANEKLAQKWHGDFVAFSIWLRDECFFDTYGDAVGSAAGWANFLLWLDDDDAEAFLFLPALYHEFYLLVCEAGGPPKMRAHLANVKLTMPEQWAIDAADNIKHKYARGKKYVKAMAAKRDKYRALMYAALEATQKGEERPLAAHVASCRAFLEKQKVRAAALVREKEEKEGDGPAIQ